MRYVLSFTLLRPIEKDEEDEEKDEKRLIRSLSCVTEVRQFKGCVFESYCYSYFDLFVFIVYPYVS